MHVEHINPAAGDHPDNLCLSCPTCNMSEAKAITAPDPETGETVPLFNPRRQSWSDHFRLFQITKSSIVGTRRASSAKPKHQIAELSFWNSLIWIDGGLRLRGLTQTGRATIVRLHINIDRVVNARSLWIKSGIHPPDLK